MVEAREHRAPCFQGQNDRSRHIAERAVWHPHVSNHLLEPEACQSIARAVEENDACSD